MNEIQKIYIALFGRPADPSGLAYFVAVTNNGTNLTAINDLAGQPEYQARFAGQGPEQIITSIYQSLFNRFPEQAGRDYFVAQLNSGALTINNIAVAIAQAAQGPDATILNNRVAAASAFTAAIDTPEELSAYSGSAAIQAAQAYINAVTADPATIPDAAEAQAAIDAIVTGTGVGDSFALTTALDNISGTSGSDVILGTTEALGVVQGQTLNSGDVVNGGAGIDTLRVVGNGNASVTVPFLTNVETIEINAFGGGTSAIDLSNSTGVKTVVLANGFGNGTVSSVGELVDIGATNVQSSAGSILTVNYLPGVVAGAADVQKVALNNASSSATTAGLSTQFQVNGIEEYAITATGTNNINLFTGGTLETVTIDGAGAVAIRAALENTVTTFNAGAATGAVSAIFTGADVKVTGGSAADLFTFGTTFNKNDTIDGGAGFDELRVSTGGDFSAAAAAAPFVALTSVERVHFTAPAAGVTLNGATFVNTGITNIQFDTNGADVINNAGSARVYEFGTPNSGSALFNMNGPSLVLNVDLLGATTASAVPANDDADVNGITMNLSGTQPASALPTLNLTSNGVSTFASDAAENGLLDIDVNETGNINFDRDGATVILDGAGDLDVNVLIDRTNFDASAFTGQLEIEGSTIAAADTAGDAFTLGSGVTEIEFNGANDSGRVNAGVLIVDTVTGFTGGSAGDVLNALATLDTGYTAITGALQAQISLLAGPAATLLNAANIAVDNVEAPAGAGWTAFTFQGATYALYDQDGGGAGSNYVTGQDILVSLTGTDVTTLTAANFA